MSFANNQNDKIMSRQNKFLLEKIIAGELDIAIDTIKAEIFVMESKELRISLGMICYDYYTLRKQVNRGIFKQEASSLAERKIVNRLLEQIL